jgi:lipopolysaccharide biosynthesis glycosyltransferase
VYTRKKESKFGFHATSITHVKAVMVNIRRLRVLTPSSLNVKYVVIVPISKLGLMQTYKNEADIVTHGYNQMNGPNGYYRESMAKLLIWNLVEYKRVVYMDSDAIVVKPLHPLFFLPNAHLASPVAYWENENCITGALLIAQPSTSLYKSLASHIDKVVAQGRTEMDLLNRYFQRILPHSSHSKNFPSVLMLPGHILALSLHFRTNIHGYGTSNKMDATDVFPDTNELENEAWIVHFSGGPKPWSRNRDHWIKQGKKATTKHFAKYNLMFLDEYDSETTSLKSSLISSTQRRAFAFHATTREEIQAVMVNVRRLRETTPKSFSVSYIVLVPESKKNDKFPDGLVIVPYNDADTRARLHLFRLERDYDKIIYVDTRTLILKPLYTLFSLPDAPLASSSAYWESENRFAESLLIVRPSNALFKTFSQNKNSYDMNVLIQHFEHRLPSSRNFPDVLMLPGHFVVTESSLDDMKDVFEMTLKELESEASIIRFTSDPWISSSSFRLLKSERVKRYYKIFQEEYSSSSSTHHSHVEEKKRTSNTDSSSRATTITVGVPAILEDMKTLQYLIDSVEKQTVLPDEIVIYMTGSTSKSPSVFKQSTNIPVRIFTEATKKMSGYSRNRVMEKASSKFVMFCDADDMMHPRRVEMVKDNLRKGYTLVLNGHQDPPFDQVLSSDVSTHEDLVRSAHTTNTRSPLLPKSPSGVTHGHPTVSREIGLKHMYKENFHGGEDTEFLHRLLLSGDVRAIFLHARLTFSYPRAWKGKRISIQSSISAPPPPSPPPRHKSVGSQNKYLQFPNQDIYGRCDLGGEPIMLSEAERACELDPLCKSFVEVEGMVYLKSCVMPDPIPKQGHTLYVQSRFYSGSQEHIPLPNPEKQFRPPSSVSSVTASSNNNKVSSAIASLNNEDHIKETQVLHEANAVRIILQYKPYKLEYPHFVSLVHETEMMENRGKRGPHPLYPTHEILSVAAEPEQLVGEIKIISNGQYSGAFDDCGYKSKYTRFGPYNKKSPKHFKVLVPLLVPGSNSFQHFVDGLLPKLIQAWNVLQQYPDAVIGLNPTIASRVIVALLNKLGFKQSQFVNIGTGTVTADTLILACKCPPLHPGLWTKARSLLGTNRTERGRNIIFLDRKRASFLPFFHLTHFICS